MSVANRRMNPNGVGAAAGLASVMASSVDCFFVSSFMISFLSFVIKPA
jgi:hypothetical protein